MTRHPGSQAFIRYLESVFYDFVSPIDEVAWSLWEEGEDTPDAHQTLENFFLLTAIYFSNIDNNVSDEEIAFIADIKGWLCNYNDDWEDFSVGDIRSYLAELAKHEIYRELRVPGIVVYLQIYDNARGTDYATQAKTMFFRFANAIVKADGQISPAEQTALANYKELLFNYHLDEDPQSEQAGATLQYTEKADDEPKNLDALLTELNSLVGLDRVQNDVAQLVNFLKVQQMREAKGMAVQPLSRHLVFYGNPGTGKTTVARLLSQIYKSLGVLSKGQLVETDRAGLVAGYVGQTALKVREVVNQAIGGVLFIDEAYALSTGGDNDFGREAIDTLIKMMEDNRDDLIVVVAGYTDKMSAFLQTNPGLRSRFNKYLEFDDYTPEQLVQIFELFCKNGGYHLSSSTSDDLIRLFSVLYETRDETFGNGRLARNLYEMTINNQANRIVSLPQVNEEILSTIEEIDIPGMADMQNIR